MDIKSIFKKTLSAGIISASMLTSSYSAPMYYLIFSEEAFSEYRYEFSLIKKGNEYNELQSDKDYDYYRKAIKLIKEKQDKIGEGKKFWLDFLRVYSLYSMARAPAEPEYAEPYLLEAKELAKKYYGIWKDPVFLFLQTSIIETLGYMYFETVESVRRGEEAIILLKKPCNICGIEKNRIVVRSNDLYFLSTYPIDKVINSKNFTEILYYYEIAKRWYEEYLKFCRENNLDEVIGKCQYPVVVENYKGRNERVLSHLKIIDEILSKYKPDYKKEEKEAVEKKEEIEKEEKKTKEKEQEKINWGEIKDKDIQDGL